MRLSAFLVLQMLSESGSIWVKWDVIMMDHKWQEFKCPFCGGSSFTSGEQCDLPSVGGTGNSITIKGVPAKVLKAEVRECRDCGYLVFKRIYN